MVKFQIIQKMYLEDGLSVREIAKNIGITFQGVHQRLQNHNIKLRPPGNSRKLRRKLSTDLIKSLYVNEDKGLREIGQMLDANPATIRRRLNLIGVALRSRGRKQRRICE